MSMKEREQASFVQRGADKSSWGKPYKSRPTAEEVRQNIAGAGNVPFERLPLETQAALLSGKQGADGVLNPGFATDPKEVRFPQKGAGEPG